MDIDKLVGNDAYRVVTYGTHFPNGFFVPDYVPFWTETVFFKAYNLSGSYELAKIPSAPSRHVYEYREYGVRLALTVDLGTIGLPVVSVLIVLNDRIKSKHQQGATPGVPLAEMESAQWADDCVQSPWFPFDPPLLGDGNSYPACSGRTVSNFFLQQRCFGADQIIQTEALSPAGVGVWEFPANPELGNGFFFRPGAPALPWIMRLNRPILNAITPDYDDHVARGGFSLHSWLPLLVVGGEAIDTTNDYQISGLRFVYADGSITELPL